MTDSVGPATDLQEINPIPEMTYQEIYKELLIHNEVYLSDVNEDDVPGLKKGLSNIKAKDNNKAKNDGLPELLEERRLEYEILEKNTQDAVHGTVRIRIMLKEPQGIRCKLIPADKTLD